jgi:hypothetical protein
LFRKVLIAVLICLSTWAHAQGSGEKAAIRYLENGRYNKAFVLLKKALRKDTTNIRATYLLGHYFFLPRNPDYQLDSAYLFSRKAYLAWQQLAMSEKDKLERQGLDSLSLAALVHRVDSAAFERAKASNSVEDLEFYLSRFKEHPFRDQALALRDELAFAIAVRRNSYEAFAEYLNTYPNARRTAQARHYYDSLLYTAKTSDQQLSSYIRFLDEFPETPYRKEVELNIFQLATASGTPEAFAQISRMADHPYSAAASAIWKGLNAHAYDSIERQVVLYPVLRKGLFGIMDNRGSEIFPPTLEALPDHYRCGNIADEVIALPNIVINNNGQSTWRGEYDAVEDMGYGFALIELKGEFFIVHNSGLRFYDSAVEDAKLLTGRVIAVKQNGHWGLLTLTGRTLVKAEWDNIDVIGHVLLLNKNNKISLTTIDNITTVDGKQKKWLEGFDLTRKIANDLLWVQSGGYEGVLDTALNILIRLEKHRVTATTQGFLLTTPIGQSLINFNGVESEPAQQVDVKGAWISSKKDNKWYLVDSQNLRRRRESYDSILFLGTFAVGLRNDSAIVWAKEKKIIKQIQPVSFTFLPAQDSTGFLVINHQDKQTVFSAEGLKLFTGSYDHIQYAAKNYFIIQKKDRQKKDKRGLIDIKGKEVLPAEYDAIGGATNGVLSLLKGGKFGQYDINTKQLIKPEYSKNIQRYTKGIYLGVKANKYGFVDARNKPLTDFTFDEVIPWTDSVALVASGKVWTLLNFRSGKVVSLPISEVKMIRDDSGEKIYRIRQGNSYGVISNRAGTIIPVKFTDLVNVGSTQHPVYFTEKHVEEAALYVVIYYNAQGKFIMKEVYEQDDYERIYCSK